MSWGFRLYFGLVLAMVLCVWALAGTAVYVAVTSPEAIGQHVGKMLGGAVSGFEKRP
jgi:hypothetical protein